MDSVSPCQEVLVLSRVLDFTPSPHSLVLLTIRFHSPLISNWSLSMIYIYSYMCKDNQGARHVRYMIMHFQNVLAKFQTTTPGKALGN